MEIRSDIVATFGIYILHWKFAFHVTILILVFRFFLDRDLTFPPVLLHVDCCHDQNTPSLSSTPQKHDFMHQENMKKIEMPKPFQL